MSPAVDSGQLTVDNEVLPLIFKPRWPHTTSKLVPHSPTVAWRVEVDFGAAGSMRLNRSEEDEAREAFDDFCSSDRDGHVKLFRVVAGVDEMMAEAFLS